jgi:hypothetical protein
MLHKDALSVWHKGICEAQTTKLCSVQYMHLCYKLNRLHDWKMFTQFNIAKILSLSVKKIETTCLAIHELSLHFMLKRHKPHQDLNLLSC